MMGRCWTLNSTGTKHMALARKKSSSRSRFPVKAGRAAADTRPRRSLRKEGTADRPPQFAICVCNDDYPASLELRKLYQVVEDEFAQAHALLRVIDESGEDYLYPHAYFVRVTLPKPVEETLHRIA